MKLMRKLLNLLVLLLSGVVLVGCGSMNSQHRSSNAVQYLYPNDTSHIETPGIPRLTLPLKVGIAFVPEGTQRNLALTESNKMELMSEVSKHFKKYDFVRSIELIPSAYLRQNGSFANLEQIRTMYDIDVITLLAYDQTRFTDNDFTSIT